MTEAGKVPDLSARKFARVWRLWSALKDVSPSEAWLILLALRRLERAGYLKMTPKGRKELQL